MSIDDKMTVDERRKYLNTMKKRYEQADQRERGRLLTEMEAITSLHRKSLIRLLHKPSLERHPRRRQRGRTYGPAVEDARWVIANSLDHICAERLQPNLVWMAQHLAAHGELTISPPVLVQLGQIKVATIRRLLQRRAPRPTSLASSGARAGQPARSRDPHETGALGRIGAGPFRGGPGPSQRTDDRGRLRAYPAMGRCHHRLE
jgi:hypothetical protein